VGGAARKSDMGDATGSRKLSELGLAHRPPFILASSCHAAVTGDIDRLNPNPNKFPIDRTWPRNGSSAKRRPTSTTTAKAPPRNPMCRPRCPRESLDPAYNRLTEICTNHPCVQVCYLDLAEFYIRHDHSTDWDLLLHSPLRLQRYSSIKCVT
jgi:hypothetical protein